MSKRILNSQLEPNFKGIWIPKGIWLSDLTPVQMLVLMQIDSLDGKFGCKASNQRLAEFFGVHKDTISDHIQNLLKKGMIDCTFTNDNDRTIRCSRKFKLIMAGLEDEIEDYKKDRKQKDFDLTVETPIATVETPIAHGGNTDYRITLEQHLKNNDVKEEKELENSVCQNDEVKENVVVNFNSKYIDLGFKNHEIETLLKETSQERLDLAMIEFENQNKKTSIKNPRGWLVKAIRTYNLDNAKQSQKNTLEMETRRLQEEIKQVENAKEEIKKGEEIKIQLEIQKNWIEKNQEEYKDCVIKAFREVEKNEILMKTVIKYAKEKRLELLEAFENCKMFNWAINNQITVAMKD